MGCPIHSKKDTVFAFPIWPGEKQEISATWEGGVVVVVDTLGDGLECGGHLNFDVAGNR